MNPRLSFESLPFYQGDPPFSAWGLYGDNDQLGALNLVRQPDRDPAARSEIKMGERASLDPPIDVLLQPTSSRSKFKQTIFCRGLN
ncbi:hypothetical protein BKA56DRAFT_478422 [Ilyonectria sp. MPI-CAGE-AT-0026]|nr:hypothetical protein BKA56DRAFT_478422 [Ilyonectria sp. MPI-CAGE-AT-0026]